MTECNGVGMPDREQCRQVPDRLSTDCLRWQCDLSGLNFQSTTDWQPAEQILAQETARDALLFGLQTNAVGQNIYVRGSRGTGRLALVKQLLEQLDLKTSQRFGYCYVQDFKRLDRPRLIKLPAGQAKSFKKRMLELADFIADGLPKALDSEPHASRRSERKEALQNRIQAISEPLSQEMAKNDMGLVSVQQGPVTVPTILPVVKGQPVSLDQLRQLIEKGVAVQAQLAQFQEKFPAYQKRLQEIAKEISDTYQAGSAEIEMLDEASARELIAGVSEPMVRHFVGPGVKEFLEEVVEDAIENFLTPTEDRPNLRDRYGVNVVLSGTDSTSRPVVIENTPSMLNLLGVVEPKWEPRGMISDYRGVRAGALLNAHQGFLVLFVNDLISEPGAWLALMRTLRTGRLEIVPPEVGRMQPHIVVQPEPIEVQVRVILIGDMANYYRLDQLDSDFRESFKVLADFDGQLERNENGIRHYVDTISRIVQTEELPPFLKDAIGALIEHGARIASRVGKLSAKFGRIADIAREAAFVAEQESDAGDPVQVTARHVCEAISRTKKRAAMPSRKFQEFVESGTILLQTKGQVVGQINGLAVMQAGPLTYGFPARITSSIGPGRAGLINIEGSAQMSGSIHTKGFHILGGLLRFLLKLPHPLAFSASIAFEQSYGGIDGDSASGAEIVCLLSALTDIPIRQGMAMTGAIDQHGHVEAIGGVNEKIEGFFDACQHFGLTGDQGVVIPHANAGDLMLRAEVVEACDKGQFHIYPVKRIEQAIELMTGMPAGTMRDGNYENDTLLGLAVEKAHGYWKRTLSSPERLTSVVESND